MINLQDAELGMWILLTLMGSVGSFLTLRLLTNLIKIQLSYPNYVREVVEMSRHERRSEITRMLAHVGYLVLGFWVFAGNQGWLQSPPTGDAVAFILIFGYAVFVLNTVNGYLLGRTLYNIRISHIARMRKEARRK